MVNKTPITTEPTLTTREVVFRKETEKFELQYQGKKYTVFRYHTYDPEFGEYENETQVLDADNQEVNEELTETLLDFIEDLK